MSKIQYSILSLLIIICFCFFKLSGFNYPQKNNYIDTFKLKYTATIHGKVKNVNENIYVGMIPLKFNTGGKEYKKLIFGDELNSFIACISEDSEKLSYINSTNIKDIRANDSGIIQDSGFLYFNKNINEHWSVSIDSSYFWKREITFVGTELLNGEKGYVYDVDIQDGYSDIGNHFTKIYYSKESGFIKFIMQTHWFPVEVNKMR